MPTTSHRPTLEDVATRAGVGRGTASRVINGGHGVSEHTRAAVEQAIDELGYVPNRAARALVTRRTDAVALVIAEAEDRVFDEPFFAGAVRGMGTALAEADKQLVLLFAPADRAGQVERYLTRQHVDGVLLLSLHDDTDLPARLQARGVPVVLGGRTCEQVTTGYVDVDNVLGGRLAVEHLAARGRRVIGTLAGPGDMQVSRERVAGYRAALADAGLEVSEDLVEHGDFGQASGEAAMGRLLRRRPDLDAVFCASDPMAAGALTALREAGRAVPEDVAVVGFDDSELARFTRPPLTTVHQSPEEMGREMVELLLGTLDAPGADPGFRVLPTHLVVRESS